MNYEQITKLEPFLDFFTDTKATVSPVGPFCRPYQPRFQLVNSEKRHPFRAENPVDLPTSRVQNFHEREARAVDFLCFLRQKRARERELRAGANYRSRK